MKKIVFGVLVFCQLQGAESIAGKDLGYRETCQKAATEDVYFKNFRSMHAYQRIVEIRTGGRKFAAYVRKCSPEILSKLDLFRKLDTIGNPGTHKYAKVGNFSPTILRYILIADQIQKLFHLPPQAKIAEIGAGFGGQCYILSQLHPFSKYYIYDLPEVNLLIEKTMATLSVNNVSCLSLDTALSEEKIDLLISNYAFSECDRDTQMAYFEHVIKKADRGYVLYNQIGKRIHQLNSLSPDEFISLLQENGMHPKTHQELIPTAPDNILITWDRTVKN